MNTRIVLRAVAHGAASLLLAGLPLLAGAQQLTVSAAASLTEAFKDIGAKFDAAHPGSVTRFNFAASGVLLQQIRQGAPADVFASADVQTVKQGIDEGLLAQEGRQVFATNAVVLVVPAGQPSAVKSVEDLAGDAVKRIAVGKTATVPVGRYTQQALEKAGLWERLSPKFVPADTVRQVLDYVARGEVEAGFVYGTDAALMAGKVAIVQEVGGHEPVAYPVAVVRDSRQQALAQEFIAYLLSPAGQDVLLHYGFSKAE